MKDFLSLASITILTVAVLVFSNSGSTIGGQQEKLETKRVMVLYSFYEDAPWDRLLDEGLRTTIASKATFPVEVINERTNLVTYTDDAYHHELAKLYRHKYSKRTLDLVIGLSDESVDFLLNYGDELFPQVPMLFVTSERISPQRRFSGPSRTAMAWGIDFKANVDLIAELLPQTQQIFIVAGNGMTDRNFMNLARTSLQGYTKRFAINYLTDFRMEDLLDKVSQLPEHSAILYVTI